MDPHVLLYKVNELDWTIVRLPHILQFYATIKEHQ